jgi:hypothetical protein
MQGGEVWWEKEVALSGHTNFVCEGWGKSLSGMKDRERVQVILNEHWQHNTLFSKGRGQVDWGGRAWQVGETKVSQTASHNER